MPQTPVDYASIMHSGGSIPIGGYIEWSIYGEGPYLNSLWLNFDCNGNTGGELQLCDYNTPWNVKWSAGIAGKGGVVLKMQTDGNLCVYDSSNTVIWQTGVLSSGAFLAGTSGDRVAVLRSGSSLGGTGNHEPVIVSLLNPIIKTGIAWNSPIVAAEWSVVMASNTVIYPSTNMILPSNSQAWIRFGTEGYLAIFGPPTPGGWVSLGGAPTYTGPSGGGTNLNMQGDGNLVIYNGSTPIWASGTSSPGANLQLNKDAGDLAVVDTSGNILWQSGIIFGYIY